METNFRIDSSISFMVVALNLTSFHFYEDKLMKKLTGNVF